MTTESSNPVGQTAAVREFHRRTEGRFAAVQDLPRLAEYARLRGWSWLAEELSEMCCRLAVGSSSPGLQDSADCKSAARSDSTHYTLTHTC